MISKWGLVLTSCLGSLPVALVGQQYELQVRVEPAAHRMRVTAIIDLPADTGARAEIAFRLASTMKEVWAHILAPAGVAGAATLTAADASGPVTTWRLAPVTPDRTFPAGVPVRLRLEYAGGEDGSIGFYLGPEVAFAGGANLPWYPQWGNGRGTGSMTFTFPSGLRLVASGVPDPATIGDGSSVQRVRVGRPVHLSFVIGPYQVLRHAQRTVPTEAYLLRVRPTSQRDLERAVAVIDRLVEEFGPFPFDRYAVVEIPTDIALRARFTGISFPGFFALSSQLLDGPFNAGAYGHEIGHAWWGVAIGQDLRAGGLYMLQEGLAQYRALQVVETLDGPAAAERLRRTGHPGSPSNHSGFGYLKLAATGLDEPLARLQPGRAGYVISDSKGFLVYDLLSRTVGRDAFRRALHAASRALAYRTISWTDLLGFVEREAGRDVQWFFDQWFDRTGAPAWTSDWHQNAETVSGTIRQSSPAYDVDVEVELRSHGCETRTDTVRLRQAVTPFRLPAPCPVDSVVVDPHFRVLHWEPTYRQQARALIAATRADHLHQIGQRADARAVYDSALRALPDPDPHGVEFNLRYGLARLELAENQPERAKAQLEAAIRAPTRVPASSLAFVYLELARLARSRGDNDALERAVANTIAADQLVGFYTGASDAARSLLPEPRR